MPVDCTVAVEVGTTPVTLDGLTPSAHWRAEDLSLADGADVTNWVDHTGNGHTLKATASVAPTYKANILAGKPVVRFASASSQYLKTDTADLLIDSGILGADGVGTIFVVAEAGAANTGSVFGSYEDASKYVELVPGATLTATNYDGSADTATISTDYRGTWTTFMWMHSSAATKVYAGVGVLGLADADLANATTGSTTTVNDNVVWIGRKSTGTYYNGDVAEIIVFTTVLTEDERNQVLAYCKSKYQLSDGVTESWTDITADVLGSSGVSFNYGLSGTDINSRVAETGKCSFVLNNSEGNANTTPGYYSPGHANHWTSFDLGTPIRVKITYGAKTYYKWRGYVDDIRVVPGIRGPGSWRVGVSCVDWMDIAARSQVSGLAMQTDVQSHEVFEAVLAAMANQPAATSVGYGSDTYPYALDNSEEEATAVMTEFQRLAASELGFIYVKGDQTQGETLVFESRAARGTTSESAYTLTETELSGLTPEYNRGDVINEALVEIFPRRVDAAATTVLFSLNTTSTTAPAIPRGTTAIFTGPFRDPDSGEYARVGGTSMVAPVATTDYTFNSAQAGTGTDLTSQLTVSAVYSANAAAIMVQNNGPLDGYLTMLQCRGKGVYSSSSIIFVASDSASQSNYGKKTQRFSMPYQSDPGVGLDVAYYILNLNKDPVTRFKTATFLANRSDAMMTAALEGDISTRITITETVTGVSADYFVNAVGFQISDGPLIRCTWSLAPTETQAYWILGVTGYTELGDTTSLSYGLFTPLWTLDSSTLGTDTYVNP